MKGRLPKKKNHILKHTQQHNIQKLNDALHNIFYNGSFIMGSFFKITKSWKKKMLIESHYIYWLLLVSLIKLYIL